MKHLILSLRLSPTVHYRMEDCSMTRMIAPSRLPTAGAGSYTESNVTGSTILTPLSLDFFRHSSFFRLYFMARSCAWQLRGPGRQENQRDHGQGYRQGALHRRSLRPQPSPRRRWRVFHAGSEYSMKQTTPQYLATATGKLESTLVSRRRRIHENIDCDTFHDQSSASSSTTV